ncbi:hypothetical protein RB653_001293 [Dictyostelium firmibasis]|uniref:Kinetochore protein Spc24 n=1 Tax=Dictyostelium firmibasis TaxID=79012 RepID=A0AAN7U3S7_9MYCE
MIEDLKEDKIKKYLDNDIDNLKRVQNLYQDITEKMIAQQDEFRTELDIWKNESIQFEKSIPTPVDEEEHSEKINYLDTRKNQLIEENNKIEEEIIFIENELSSIRLKKTQLINKENQLTHENTITIPNKEYLFSLYTNITGIKWSNNDNNNNNNNLPTTSSTGTSSPSQQEQQHQSQFIKGIILDTQSLNQNNCQIKPFLIDKNQYSNDFDIVNKIWDLID